MTKSSISEESGENTRQDLWVVLATQGFLLVALAFWYGTYLSAPSAYLWAIPGVLAGSLFLLLYARSRRRTASRR